VRRARRSAQRPHPLPGRECGFEDPHLANGWTFGVEICSASDSPEDDCACGGSRHRTSATCATAWQPAVFWCPLGVMRASATFGLSITHVRPEIEVRSVSSMGRTSISNVGTRN
jgi:hypothetical protein